MHLVLFNRKVHSEARKDIHNTAYFLKSRLFYYGWLPVLAYAHQETPHPSSEPRMPLRSRTCRKCQTRTRRSEFDSGCVEYHYSYTFVRCMCTCTISTTERELQFQTDAPTAVFLVVVTGSSLFLVLDTRKTEKLERNFPAT